MNVGLYSYRIGLFRECLVFACVFRKTRMHSDAKICHNHT